MSCLCVGEGVIETASGRGRVGQAAGCSVQGCQWSWRQNSTRGHTLRLLTCPVGVKQLQQRFLQHVLWNWMKRLTTKKLGLS